LRAAEVANDVRGAGFVNSFSAPAFFSPPAAAPSATGG
jgi:hypothetical protein